MKLIKMVAEVLIEGWPVALLIAVSWAVSWIVF